MHINNIPDSEIYLTKQSAIGFLAGSLESMGGVCKARQFKKKKRELIW
jgi:hypothetical protein